MIREEDPPRPSARISTLGASRHDDLGAPQDGPGQAQPALASRPGLDRNEGPSEGPHRGATRRPADFARDIERYLADEPVEARPPTLADRTAKWARRHRPLVWAGLAFLALSAIGLAASTLSLIAWEETKTAAAYQGEKDQRQIAQQKEQAAQEATDASGKPRTNPRDTVSRPRPISSGRWTPWTRCSPK